MSDFLIVFSSAVSGKALLDLLQEPYFPEARSGRIYEGTWGNLAMLEEAIESGANLLEMENGFVGWLGDLPGASESVGQLANAFFHPEMPTQRLSAKYLAERRWTRNLNGSFAVVMADSHRVAVMSDPMAGVQIYVARDDEGRVLAMGSHSDLVAVTAGVSGQLDPISMADYLDTGTPCCPHTMYSRVTELEPGTVLVVSDSGHVESAVWWEPPDEDRNFDLEETVSEYAVLWKKAVESRCTGNRIGVQLSGGMDSRIVIASIPQELDCTGVTFCDAENRETRISKQVAECYERDWMLLLREPEFLGNTAMRATRFIGCEGEWHHAHALGLEKEFRGRNFENVFTGLFVDNNFKGYYAKDLAVQSRGKGLLPPKCISKPKNYPNASTPWCKHVLKSEIQEARITRRQNHYDRHFARGRQSEWEWLDGYPVSQASDNTGWFVERRILPMRLPVYDRQLVELAMRIPATEKAGGQFFNRAIVHLLGPGNRIPNANDGSKPGSSEAQQRRQRLVRKFQRRVRSGMDVLGWRLPVPHSWHDYSHYWNTSKVIRDLISHHNSHLAPLEQIAPMDEINGALTNHQLPWRQPYRLLQFMLWRSWVEMLEQHFSNKLIETRNTDQLKATANLPYTH